MPLISGSYWHRGEQFSVMFKSLSKGERNVTSSSIPAERQRDDNVLYSDKYNAGMGINRPIAYYCPLI